MIEAIRNIFNIPDLRKRVLFTLMLLAVYRVGGQIPNPGISSGALAEFWQTQRGTIFGFVDLFSGRFMSRMTIFALGIMPYISASIILQLLTVVWPYLERLSKEGELGRRKINQYTRYGTIFICIIQSWAIALFLQGLKSPAGAPIVPHPGIGFQLLTVLTLTTGTVFLMWLGEQISERGIGNGISLIIFAGIVVNFPSGLNSVLMGLRTGNMDPLRLIFLLFLMLAVIAIIVFVERGQRRIPVSYAKRVIGRKIYGGQSTHLPLRVNTGGVIPIIFAASVVTLPATIAQLLPTSFFEKMARQFRMGMPLYNLLYIASIIFFTYFYTAVIYNPVEIAENLQKNGGFITGVRPGQKTSEYIYRVLSRLTFIGALYLSAVCVLPEIL
ncbi:MAG: preprotein translocase subunit SecY, partial [Candidatus Paceibacteria bacterium]